MNEQPVEKSDLDSSDLDVHSIWDTIQGEGPFAGYPATFIRLAGCNLQCKWCDTDYTSRRRRLSVVQVQNAIRLLPKRDLVVITGGEPFRQRLGSLVVSFLGLDLTVQIETNGILQFQPEIRELIRDGRLVEVVCSPKTPEVHQDVFAHCFNLKYVVKYGEVGDDGLPLKSVGSQYGAPARPPKDWEGSIFIQPLDEEDPYKNTLNLRAAVDSCRKFNYILSTQVHKVAGLE